MDRKARNKAWSAVLLYVVGLFLSLPYAPAWWFFFRHQCGAFTPFVLNTLALTGGLSLLLYLILFRREKRPSAYLWFSALAVVYGYFLGRIRFLPERIHVLEYGLLSYLVGRGFRQGKSPGWRGWVYLKSLPLLLLVSLLDEGIQFLLPNRAADPRDILLKGISALLGLTLTLCVFDPSHAGHPGAL
ncbi:MAG: VanZ family protein [Candidatus Tectomicrobia bacterium]|uniref:VanZ family protein n=1 Tax=Tectimicrobiota bacterium TaxID=2528274 RepID=A0A932CMC4_UNCTE|nr:VanZ family protein [Candidatus Tectomicrobia bacterium]